MTIDFVRKGSRKIAVLGLVGGALLSLKQPGQFYKSYLFAYETVLGIGLGCLGILLLHSLVGGEWGNASRHILQAGADSLPWLAALFIPILFGLRHIYPWRDAAQFLGSYAGAHKQLYFRLPFFALRALLYFAFWVWIARRQHQTKTGSAVGLAFYVLTVSFAAFDWFMSLEPNWSSSIYGAMLMIGDALSALAFVVVILQWQATQSQNPRAEMADDATHDIGNLMLSFVMLWAYMALSQYLIIWSANLPEEIGWYTARQRGGWQFVALILIFFQLALPFFLLLARRRKRKLARLARVAALILAMRVIDGFWLTVPDFSPGIFSLHMLDFLALMLVGGTWLSVFCNQLQTEGTR